MLYPTVIDIDFPEINVTLLGERQAVLSFIPVDTIIPTLMEYFQRIGLEVTQEEDWINIHERAEVRYQYHRMAIRIERDIEHHDPLRCRLNSTGKNGIMKFAKLPLEITFDITKDMGLDVYRALHYAAMIEEMAKFGVIIENYFRDRQFGQFVASA